MTAAAELDRTYHEPVMGAEVLEHLGPTGSALILDATVGGGGHSRLILESCAACTLIGIDQDPEALAEASRNLEEFEGRVRLVRGRYDEVISTEIEPGSLGAALFDLGVSSHQVDEDARGFSFRRGVALDMRMGPGGASAADLLNDLSQEDLEEIFRRYGEVPGAKRLAREIVRRRRSRPFRTADDLVAAIGGSLGRGAGPREKARVFQALRIAVNDELVSLERGLEAVRETLCPGGVVAVISYHSLEDRIVKNTFREWGRSCVCPPGAPICTCRGVPLGRVLTRKPVEAGAEEVARNPRARSARLRAWRKAE